ncbi:MAG: hypothetical protein JWO32_2653 [Bacteroidetes bacterium]|nr:hypothetical protein [Bacteroidota bacterium]
MNKAHWNTVVCAGAIPNKMISEWIDDSYELIVKSLPAKKRNELK